MALTIIIFRFDNLRLGVLVIRGLSPFFTGYIWQLNFNLAMGIVYLIIAGLFLLGLNLILQMPTMTPTSIGPFASTNNWTYGWAPILQLVLLLFLSDILLNLVQLVNANVTALWYF